MCRGALKFGVRWKTVRCPASRAMTGIAWTPDEPHATPREVDLLPRPARGLEAPPREVLPAFDIDGLRRGEQACPHHAVARDDALFGGEVEDPSLGVFVPDRRVYPALELDVAVQVEALRNVLQVALDLGLRGVALRPLPLLLQLLGEAEGVLEALDVTARARVAVPVPGPPDTRAGLVDPEPEAHLSESVEHVEAGEAGAYDRDVEEGRLPGSRLRVDHGRSSPGEGRPTSRTPRGRAGRRDFAACRCPRPRAR